MLTPERIQALYPDSLLCLTALTVSSIMKMYRVDIFGAFQYRSFYDSSSRCSLVQIQEIEEMVTEYSSSPCDSNWYILVASKLINAYFYVR